MNAEARRKGPGSTDDLLAEGHPQSSVAAERAVLGALLCAGPEMAGEILSAVQDSDFADPRCSWLVPIVRTLHAAGDPFDPMALVAHVRSHVLLAPGPKLVNLAEWVHELFRDAPPPVTGPWWAAKVVEASVRRAVSDAAARLTVAAERGDVDDLAQVVNAETSQLLAVVGRVTVR